jgi:hypothetical protein
VVLAKSQDAVEVTLDKDASVGGKSLTAGDPWISA